MGLRSRWKGALSCPDKHAGVGAVCHVSHKDPHKCITPGSKPLAVAAAGLSPLQAGVDAVLSWARDGLVGCAPVGLTELPCAIQLPLLVTARGAERLWVCY